MPNLMMNVPIFPLSTTLFPEGQLSLKIFEPRYLEMVSRCLKSNTPFGVCLILDGKEVGPAAACCSMGTLTKITNWDHSENGLLLLEAEGGQRFEIQDKEVSKQQLIVAKIKLLDKPDIVQVPPALKQLAGILERFLKKAQPALLIDQQKLTDAAWVSYRLAEILPMEGMMRQRLLEMDDAIERLYLVLRLVTEK